MSSSSVGLDSDLLGRVRGLVRDGRYPSILSAMNAIVGGFLDGADDDARDGIIADLRKQVDILTDSLKNRPNGGRVAVFLDLKNVSFPVRDSGFSVDFLELRRIAVDGRRQVSATAFDTRRVKDGFDGAATFHSMLESCGWRLDLHDMYDEGRQKEVDVAMATAMVTGAYEDRYDVAVVISGDRDFVPAMECVRNRGKTVEVMSFSGNLSKCSGRAADSVTLLDDLFLLNPTGVSE